MIDELTRIYLNETRFKSKLSEVEARKYFECLTAKGNIYCAARNNEIAGYIEWFMCNEEQVRRIVSGGEFHIGEEDITTGCYCYINDVFIDKKFRGKEVWKELKQGLFKRTKGCLAYLGEKQKHNDMLVIRRA